MSAGAESMGRGCLRGGALVAWVLCVATLSSPASAQDGQRIYRYRGADGREVFTNILDEVPPEQRAAGEVDLSRVALNTGIGNDLNARLHAQHAQLAASSYCVGLKAEAEKEPLQRLWDEHAPLVVCGGLIALLLFVTPSMLRKMNAPDWARVLTKAIPALFVVGGVMYGMNKANRTASMVKQQLQPCLAETFAGLDSPDGNNEGATEDKQKLIARLKQEIERAQQLAAQRSSSVADLVQP